MDLQQRIQLIIGGDAKQAEKVLNEVNQHLQDTATNAKTQGKNTGDKFGQEMARAQDRWLKVLQTGLRQYGGAWGRVLAGVIEQFEKVDKAIAATNKAAATANAVGAATPNRRGAVASEVVAETGGHIAGTAAGSAAGIGLYNKRNSLFDVIRQRKEANQLALAFGHKPPNPGAIETTLEFAMRGLKKGGSKALGLAARLPMGVLGMLGGGAIAGATLGGLSKLASGSDEREAIAKQIEITRELVREIEKIKDPVAKTKAIIKEFGEDGQAAYRAAANAVKEYDKAQTDGEKAMRVFGYTARTVINTMKEWVTDGASWIARVTGISFAFRKIGEGALWAAEKITGITPEMVKSIAEGEALTERLEKKLDDKRKERIKKTEQDREDAKKKAEKDAEELKKSQEEYTKAVEESKFEQASVADKIKLARQKQTELTIEILRSKKGTKEHNELLIQQVKLNQQVVELQKEQAEERAKAAVDQGDKSRLSLDDLSSMDAKTKRQIENQKKAQQIQKLEADAQLAVADNNRIVAEKLLAEAQKLRRELGQLGVLKSSEFNNVPGRGERATIADMVRLDPSLSKDYGNYARLMDMYNKASDPSERFNVKTAIGAQLQLIQKKIEEKRNSDPAQIMANEFVKHGNALPVIPHNGK
jgi:hypothetical protein